MSRARQLVISYGGWSSSDSGWEPLGTHSTTQDLHSYSITFDVVCLASDSADLATKLAAFEAEMEQSNQRSIVTYYSSDIIDLDPGVSSWTCQSSQAQVETLEELRSYRARAFRVTLTGARNRTGDAGKEGRRSQTFRVLTTPEGLRALEVHVTFTPLAAVGTAYHVSQDATYGFAKAVSDYQTSLGGTWDSAEPTVERDEDDRFVSISAIYAEIGYAQSADGTDDATLVGPSYVIFSAESATTTIQELAGTSLVELRVVFRSGVRRSQSTDLDSVIRSKVIPYIRSTVSSVLQSTGTLVELRRNLEGDPVTNRIAGSVDFLAVTGGAVLNAGKRIQSEEDEGIEYLDVLDGEDYTVDEHRSGKQATRVVTLTVEEVGAFGPSVDGYLSGSLVALAEAEIQAQEAEGYAHTGKASEAAEILEQLDGASWQRVVSVAFLRFRRVIVQRAASDSIQSVER